jgi:riboflavin transporter FmnP
VETGPSSFFKALVTIKGAIGFPFIMHPRRNSLWFLFIPSALAAIALFFIPAFIIRPFRHQTPSALALAMALRQRAPLGTVAAAVLCLVFAIILWGATSKSRKFILASVMVVVAFAAVMSRLNYFEWMFHPVDAPLFESASASKLDKGEMILAIRYGSDARAYPIREMAYHHVLNDVVASVPVAVTY